MRKVEFSPDRRYRFTLEVAVDNSLRKRSAINFVMLNPSTADEVQNDPTVARCCRRAMQWGFSHLIVTNIFAYRSTDPKVLYTLEDPVGRGNDDYILPCARNSDLVVCAWGNHGLLRGRGEEVRKLLARYNPHYLLMSETTGQPYHPLYLSYKLKPVPWKGSTPFLIKEKTWGRLL